MLAQDLAQWQTALAIWKTIVPVERFSHDAKGMLRAAYWAGEDAFILDFCAALRHRGIHEWYCYQVEADVLNRNREPDKAIELLQGWIASRPKDGDAKLVLAAIARLAGRDELAIDDKRDVPPVESWKHPQRGATAVFVLRHGKNPLHGVEYAYELWRRFPDSMIARQALIVAVFSPQAPPMKVPRPGTVVPGCAARIQEGDGDPSAPVFEWDHELAATNRNSPPIVHRRHRSFLLWLRRLAFNK